MDKKSRSQRNAAVKDLTPRNPTGVKGGAPAPKLYETACKGTHLPEVTLELW